ncbi:universal stress protein [Natronomonas sp. LN261]|uniref:universal stress protein n=1 Tax=Natronomonas sp. LN261 TaxID=2750669 RepID=UPI0015EF89F8|nr:universal stress protein [Natronomonas sp. LN261]
MTQLTTRMLLPVVHEEDTKRTCKALFEHRPGEPDSSKIIVVHAIEKAGGAPDKAPLPAREEQAERVFALAEQILGGRGYEVETRLIYATDVVDALFDVAREVEATSIVFLPREGGRLSRLLTGNLSTRLVLDSPIPVITLPQVSDDEE